LRGDVAAVRTHATAALQLAEAQGFASMQEAGRIYRGWALSMQEDDHEGTLQIRQGIAALRSTSGITFRTYYLALLAEAYQKTGQIEEGLSVLAEALTLLVDKMGERFYEAELYRLKGELLLTQLRLQGSASNLLTSPKQVSGKSKASQGKVAVPSVQSPMAKAQSEAEECFLKAIDIARRQQAKSLELRATMSLARLWKQQGKHHEARTTLSALYNWFTEGFDTADLQEATMLLNELH
jgi:predicted ATPase